MSVTKEQIFAFARTLMGTQIDQPFEGDFDTTVLRHGASGKWYGLVLQVPHRYVGMDGDGTVWAINLKCDPFLSDILRDTYRGILPAYHMNKYHWITVLLDSDVPWSELCDRIAMSYELTAPRTRRAPRRNVAFCTKRHAKRRRLCSK